MVNISEKVSKTIKQGNIIPEPKWHFLLKNYIFWLLLSITMFINTIAVDTILFMLLDHDWQVFKYFDRGLVKDIFISIPYFWIAIFALFMTISYYSFKHMREGYRYEMYKIITLCLLLSIGIGAILFWAGLDSEIHEMFSEQIPFYNNLVHTKKDIWIFPDKGLLSGEITDVKDKNEFLFRDFKGNVWQIQNNGAIWPENIIARKGTKLKLIGERKANRIFSIKIVKSWDWSR